MPLRDMTGPQGEGPMTGRGLGQMGQMPNIAGAPMGAQGMPQGMPDAGAMPMEGMGEGNPEAEYDQIVSQMPQEEIDRIIQMLNQNPEAIIMEYTQKLLQVEEVGGDQASALNLAKNLVIHVLTQEMVKTGKTLSELCPNLAQQIQQPSEEGQPGQPMPQQPMEQPAGQPPMPSVLGGGV